MSKSRFVYNVLYFTRPYNHGSSLVDLRVAAVKSTQSYITYRLQDAVDHTLREEQAGSREGRSCTEQIFALRNVLEQSLEYKKYLTVSFIDLKKAFEVFTERHCERY